jgi:galactokinase
MQAGLSSSSALNVIWIKFLSELFGYKLTEMEITKFAHKAEVLEFNEPGGMQDHMAITHGFVNYEEFDPIKCTRLKTILPGLVIGNSLERKDTLNTLAKIKNGVQKGLSYLGVQYVKELAMNDIKILETDNQHKFDNYSLKSLKAAVTNYEITKKAYLELKKSSDSYDEEYVGNLMTIHHQSLRDNLDVSTPKIEKMIEVAMNVGALGCKITGSGNGGCMIAYCPGAEKEVYQAIERVGAQAYIANIVPGVSLRE